MRTFDELFTELSTTRSRLEAMRSAGDHFSERAALQSRLHGLRAEIALARREA